MKKFRISFTGTCDISADNAQNAMLAFNSYIEQDLPLPHNLYSVDECEKVDDEEIVDMEKRIDFTVSLPGWTSEAAYVVFNTILQYTKYMYIENSVDTVPTAIFKDVEPIVYDNICRFLDTLCPDAIIS